MGTMSVDELLEGILSGRRRALAKAISLVESTRPGDFERSQQLLTKILPYTGNSLRVGITGVPGVGKSSLIEEFGLLLAGKGHRLAVLAIDPSSSRTGGSILGDKVRMNRLSRCEQVYIRPSASGGALGGVARKTRETILLCEAAGYDFILVETVGVGQSETELASIVDFFIMLLLPNAGDEIQGIKRGIMEMADCFVITKADGEQKKLAAEAKRKLHSALQLMLPKYPEWQARILSSSAVEKSGLEEIFEECKRFFTNRALIDGIRKEQQRQWMRRIIGDELGRLFYSHPGVLEALRGVDAAVGEGSMLPTKAATVLLDIFMNGKNFSTYTDSEHEYKSDSGITPQL